MTSFSLFTLSFNHVPTLEQEHFFAKKFVKMLSRKERKRLTATRAYAHGSQLRLSPLAPASALPLTHPAYTRIQMRCPAAMPRSSMVALAHRTLRTLQRNKYPKKTDSSRRSRICRE